MSPCLVCLCTSTPTQHDAQLDYYGKRLATASSDRTIRIFDVSLQQQTLLARISAHDGPIWQVQWAHPKFGPLLASASYDGRAIVWKEVQQGQWVKVFETAKPEASSQQYNTAHITQQLTHSRPEQRMESVCTDRSPAALSVLLRLVCSLCSNSEFHQLRSSLVRSHSRLRVQ